MRKILLFMLALLLFNTSWAQDAPPEMFKFQALITKPDGKPVKNKTVGVKISIRQSATNGTLVYRETFTPTTNNAGIINIEIGNGTPKYGVFSEIPWEAGEFFLKLRVDINGGTNYTNMGTSQLLSVPYALYAKHAQSVVGDNDTDPTNEIQTLSLESNILSLSDGGEVTLPSLEDFSYYFADRDKDAYGDRWSAVYSPSAPVGYVDNENDCDDNDADVFPGAAEICDGIDNNCDGNIDEGVTTTYYADADGDGNGDFQTTMEACSEPNGYVSDSSDCDDSDASVFPGTAEICDGIDNDCDGEIDEGCTADNDNDGFTIEQGDCNDSDPTVNPEEEEVCDGKDNDCDGQIDEDIDLQSDSENCGACGEFCPPGTSCIGGTCVPIPDYDEDGYTVEQGDCDDNDATINPGAQEVCDDADNDCDGQTDEDCLTLTDNDGDGYTSDIDCDDTDASIHPNATDICGDGIDQDCDGEIDENCEWYTDPDGDGILSIDEDINQNGNPEDDDTDGDNIPNYLDPDDDGDQLYTIIEDDDGNGDPTNDDADGDGIPNYLETDSDDDGLQDQEEDIDLDGNVDNVNQFNELDVNETDPYDSDTDDDYYIDGYDCRPLNKDINQGAEEICNGIDDNCNGIIDEDCTPGPEIGDYYQGGIVYYFLQPGDIGYVEGETHGLICAVSDYPSATIGLCEVPLNNGGPLYTAIGKGLINTNYIIYYSQYEYPFGAGEARAYRGGGYTDWFLPSLDELQQIYINREVIITSALANGGEAFYESGSYWSSSTTSEEWGYMVNFVIGGYNNEPLGQPGRVRPVRYF